MGFPTKNDHFGVFWGYHHLRKHPFESTSETTQPSRVSTPLNYTDFINNKGRFAAIAELVEFTPLKIDMEHKKTPN